jgi:hypothetical protein
MPFAGVSRAAKVIAKFAREAEDDLSVAHRAGTLWTIVQVTWVGETQDYMYEPHGIISALGMEQVKK